MSQLKLFSLGIVVEDKPRGSDKITVNPIEEIFIFNGLLSKDERKYDVTVPNMKGVKLSANVKGNVHLDATWIPYGHSNRMTSPNVCKNETVAIYRYADTDDYYWTTIFREPKLRRLEDVIYAFSNLSKGLEPFDFNSSYWFRVNTIDKIVRLHTSKSDGEPFEYDIIVDTGNGNIVIKDDIGNQIKLDSKSNTISAEALEEIKLKAPKVTLDTTTIVMKASDSITNDTPDVINTGAEHTTGSSYANPHYHCRD